MLSRGAVVGIALLLGVVASGCLLLPGVGSVNRRVATWSAARAELWLHPMPNRSQGAYTQLFVFLDRLGRPLLLRLPDGSVASTSDLTPARIWPYTFEGRRRQVYPSGLDRGERQFDLVFDCSFWTSGGGMNLTFRDNRLVSLELGGNDASLPESCRPALGETGREDALLVMPVPESGLVALFGPPLDRRDVWAGL